jgi:hypothetical protein
MMNVLKNCVGLLIRFPTSQTNSSPTTARPISETTLGRGRFRRFASGEGGSVRACVAILPSSFEAWGRAEALPQVPLAGL